MSIQDTPKISIITCFLNVEEYIQETIESVLKQEYGIWELLLIDDGSTDKSTDIAKKFADEYPGKIIYCEHKNHINRGSSASRNVGIKKASGTLIAFLDADDVWLPGMLSHILKLMRQHPVSMVCEATEYWYNWNDTAKQNKIVQIGAPQDRVYVPPELILTIYPLADGSPAAPCLCGMLITKESVVRHGAFDESFSGMYDDQAFLIKFYLHESVYISSTCDNKYRQRPGSLVHSSHGQSNYLKERKYFLKWLKNYLQQNNINYVEVNFLLQKELLSYKPVTYFLKYTLPQKIKRVWRKRFN